MLLSEKRNIRGYICEWNKAFDITLEDKQEQWTMNAIHPLDNV